MSKKLEREISFNQVFAEIASLLAGFSFTALLLLLQSKNEFDVSTTYWLSGSLSFSCIIFVFIALFCTLTEPPNTVNLFFAGLVGAGFTSFFISLFLVLSLINQKIAILSTFLVGFLFVTWILAVKFSN